MEMPIAVIITLFVAVVVAGVLITFSQNVILKGRENINELNPKEESKLEDKLIKVASMDADSLYDLAIQCAKDVSGSADETLCFIIKSESFVDIDSINGEIIPVGERNLTINVDVGASYNALFVNYNPLGSIDIKS